MSEAENIARKVLNKRINEGWSQAKIAEACDSHTVSVQVAPHVGAWVEMSIRRR